MRTLTDAEKQQLRAKIKDERKRQYQAVRKIVRKNDEQPNKILFLLFFWDIFGIWDSFRFWND